MTGRRAGENPQLAAGSSPGRKRPRGWPSPPAAAWASSQSHQPLGVGTAAALSVSFPLQVTVSIFTFSQDPALGLAQEEIQGDFGHVSTLQGWKLLQCLPVTWGNRVRIAEFGFSRCHTPLA